ncbi:tubulin-binding cofactor C [Arctopsyche grandis]|uniref:tubulin-binding cofactor C n=1 Tax=Arctopsyche grandis TaxID=121162 RepID=UPI00406D989D
MDDKDTIVDRLYKRNAKRIELLEKQRKLKEEINVSNEQLDYFNGIFKEKSDTIEMALNKVESLEEALMLSHFENIKKELYDLQNFVATSSFFLKDYSIRKSQAVIQNLQTRSIELEKTYLPKKKFGFRNKSTLKKHDDILKDSSADIVDNNIKAANKIKWDTFSCGFTNRKNEKLILDSENVSGKDVHLSRIDNCVVIIKGSPATMHLDNVLNSTILCGPVSTSVFMDNCNTCKMALACQQLRCHSSIDCNIYLHVTSKAIIEDSHGIQVAPYNLKYEGMNEDYVTSSLDLNKNNWDSLDDFNWLAADVRSPNWRVLDESLRISNWSAYV